MQVTLFALESEVESLRESLNTLHGNSRVPALVSLAWHQKQSNSALALQWADEAQSLTANQTPGDLQTLAVSARLALVRGEAEYLFARLDAADAWVNEAVQAFHRLEDAAGLGDAYWLMASIWSDRGNRERCEECLQQTDQHYHLSGDPQRVSAAVARRLFLMAFEDPSTAAARLDAAFPARNPVDVGVSVWLLSARAVVKTITSDYLDSIALWQSAMQAARQSGQLRQAIISSLNLSNSFLALGDLDAALESAETATGLARPTGWPGMVSGCLQQTGNGLRQLKRFEEARALLSEALDAAGQLKGSRNYAVILGYLGDLCLDAGDTADALEWFVQYEEAIRSFPEPNLYMVALRGQATALSRLNRPQEANAKVQHALKLAREHANLDQQVDALRALADLHRRHALPLPNPMGAPNACLHYLEKALVVAQQISGYVAPAEFLQEASRAYAASGNFELAYQHAQAAAESLDKARHTEATKRVMAMQVRHATQRSSEEAENHRRLAKTEAEKALLLQQTSATLEVLGQIGREITACLNPDDVYNALYRHVNEMLDATSFDIYLTEVDSDGLCGAFSMENGRPYALDRIPFSDLESYSVRCAKERRELAINAPSEDDTFNLIEGTLNTQSLFFAPLLAGDRLLGVMSIQSVKANAYGEREYAIFRTLCAYGAIAIDNANAYAQAQGARKQADDALANLRDAQARLVQSEKLAALGKLVAGVAHELNTPLGNSQMALTTLRSQLEAFREGVATTGLRRSDFDAFLDNVNEGSELALSGVSRSAALVAKFKQLAVHQHQGERQEFRVRDAVSQALVSISGLLKSTPYRIEIDIPESWVIDSYPQALAETLGILLSNALLHGVAGRPHGLVKVSVHDAGPSGLQLRVQDDGAGISANDLPRIFDPFFSTKFGQGGSGLGLHLAHNMAIQVLGGRLTVESTLGHGSTFMLDLPRYAQGSEISA